ncbi:MAG TPA: glycoside hydrolase family 20 zincin-like fold domain-containing protein [Planctomycetota bacterium]|nr:glycoside hydrolase family 20 zincin-like fold domain-containing protein [Planctomycetota bacterium]
MDDGIQLIPRPRSVEPGSGRCAAREPWRMHPTTAADAAVAHLIARLGVAVEGDASLPPRTLRIGAARATAPLVAKRQGYGLVIDGDGVAMVGHDDHGFHYGLITLEQLRADDGSLPAVVIADWPAVAIRYHHDDVSRRQVSTLDDFRRIVRHLARFKISHYTLYLEDMVRLDAHPEIGATRGALSAEEIAAIVAEGALHRVEVFPTFQLIGHQEHLLAMPRYAHLGQRVFQPMSSLDPTKPEVRAFLAPIIAEVASRFPSPLFHMGFDETQGVDREAFIAHANWCAERLVALGKTPLMWVDMLCHGFGHEQMVRLHPAIVPVNWQYEPGAGPVAHQRELEAQGRPVWGLAGYNTWSRFLPDQPAVEGHLATWVRQLTADGREDGALGGSQWGDGGCESGREPWGIIAAFAEAAWSGPAARPADRDERFQRAFYGAALPGVTRVPGEWSRELRHGSDALFTQHHRGPHAMVRAAAWSTAPGDEDLAHDERLIDRCLATIAAERPLARREADHLDHLAVACERMRSVVRRQRAARRWLQAPDPAAADAVADEMLAVRARWRALWLRQCKPEGLEMSSAVFTDLAARWRDLGRPSPVVDAARWLPLDLDHAYDQAAPEVADVPIGAHALGHVPLRFAPVARTHARLTAARGTLTLPFAPGAVRDLHLLASAARPADAKPVPGLRVALLRDGRVVHREDLLLIRHLCDWFAPRGEHMWAGGGLAHVDHARVDWAVPAGDPFGICRVRGFAAGGVAADAVELTALGPATVELFALTVERG